MAELKIEGLADLHKVLQTLPEELEKKVLRNALRAGASVMKKAAQDQVPVESGALRKSIKVKTSARKGRYRLKANIVAGDKGAYYAHMVEFGTAEHMIKPAKKKALSFGGKPVEGVKHPGADPHPFMRPALDAATEASVEAFAASVRRRLTREGAL